MVFDWSDWPQTTVSKSDIKDMGNLSLATKRPWRGLRARDGSLFTDGSVIYHINRVANSALAKELRDKDGGDDLSPEQMNGLWESVTEDDPPKYKAKVRGYVTQPPHFYGLCDQLAVIGWKNYQRHWGVDAKHLMQVSHVVGDHTGYLDERGLMVMRKSSGKAAAVLKVYTLPLTVE